MAHRHYHRRRNPMSGGKGGILGMILSAAVGGFATRAVPQAFLSSSNSGIMGYGANAVVAVGGSWLLKKFMGPKIALGWLIGGGAAIALRIYQDYTTGASAAGASDGTMSLYIGSNFPLPTYTTGSPLANPSYNWAGAPTSIGAGGNPATAAAVQTAMPTSTPYSRRLGGRFTH